MVSQRAFVLSAVLSAVALGDDTKPCRPAPEIMYLHDASTSLNNVKANMTNDMADVFGKLKETYSQVRFGVATWADKPMPFRGVGQRNSIPDLDHCYVRNAALTDDIEVAKNGLQSSAGMCGGDFPENPYEAILGAVTDPEAGWLEFPEESKIAGFKPFRTIVFATDDVPHFKGEAQAGLNEFNKPRYPPAGVDEADYIGGFGHPRLLELYLGVITFDKQPGYTGQDYTDMCTAWYKNDSDYKSMSAQDTNVLTSGIYDFGPAQFPEVSPHPGTFDAVSECHKYEYLDLSVVGNAILAANTSVIGMLSAPAQVSPASQKICRDRGYKGSLSEPADMLACMIALYKSDFEHMNVNAVIAPFNKPVDLLPIIAKAIENAPEYACPITPTLPPGHTVVPPTTPVTPAAAGGSSTGTVAGASAGAAAGLAALGGLAYRKFGSFARGPSANPTIETNEEVPDTPMERESMEEVTMDMFQ